MANEVDLENYTFSAGEGGGLPYLTSREIKGKGVQTLKIKQVLGLSENRFKQGQVNVIYQVEYQGKDYRFRLTKLNESILARAGIKKPQELVGKEIKFIVEPTRVGDTIRLLPEA